MRISEWMCMNVRHLEQYLVKNIRTHRCFEHFILRNDLRAAEGSADKCGSTLRSLDYIYGLCARVWARLKFCESPCPSATLRLHIQAVPHYIMKSWASDLFKCNGQYKCWLALFASNCSQMFCTPLCPTSCCSRLTQTPHTVFRLYYSGETWHGVSV